MLRDGFVLNQFIIDNSNMKVINLHAVDLNLLVVIDALVTERSVSRAARRLHLTQPAVSHALGRLRTLFGDRLFVRTPLGMAPTSFTEHIAPRIAAMLQGVSDLLTRQEAAAFEAASSQRRFNVGMTDYTAFVLMPALARHLEACAPHVELVVRPTDRVSGIGMIDREEVELVIGGTFPSQPSYLSSAPLLSEKSLCAARSGHPAFARRLTRRAYLSGLHLHVSPWGERGYIDDVLHRQRVSRRIGLTIGHFLLAPAILEQTDLIATLPERVVRPMATRFALSVSEPPFDLGATEILQYWHRRLDANAGLLWLRQQVAAIAHST
jgi:DNA-binding transcriptional LysR family regulator